ncbi:hypothetical protein [Sulfitobacter aestuariivivens]|uniref:Argininosuccinate lyase n=1 Tax=Sulfitobacter aestuariivivens TaxID=2766981 RepID=A0A927D565_9RHOB|nr:hypothetical protein [Sulfitobacter aestuariivivens]MBD3664034.1 hypothetical protein [Sulfitobacter aestuariivivens]
MRRIFAVICALTFLAACGADGEPVQPTGNANVSISSSGAYVGTNLAIGQGPVRVSLGLGL